jgi:hypothetical protein
LLNTIPDAVYVFVDILEVELRVPSLNPWRVPMLHDLTHRNNAIAKNDHVYIDCAYAYSLHALFGSLHDLDFSASLGSEPTLMMCCIENTVLAFCLFARQYDTFSLLYDVCTLSICE